MARQQLVWWRLLVAWLCELYLVMSGRLLSLIHSTARGAFAVRSHGGGKLHVIFVRCSALCPVRQTLAHKGRRAHRVSARTGV